MSLKKNFLLLNAILLLSVSAVSAQVKATKYGHMNLGNLLEMLPETKKANETLKVFTDQIAAKDDSLVKAFQAEYSRLEAAAQKGDLTGVQIQQAQQDLQKKQEFIQKFEQDAQQMVAAKREELLSPILKKINETIKTVAVENGFLMIFDTSSGAALYALETEDLTPLVKKKLGL